MSSTNGRARIHFYWDPGCPWAYVTSRWVANVAAANGMDVRWRLFSLRMKNAPEGQSPEERREFLAKGMGHRALRVAAAVREQAGGEDALSRVYAEMGRRRHSQNADIGSAEELASILEACALDASLAAAADDERWDAEIEADMAEAVAKAGSDVGVPTIVLDDGAGPAWFGPVISRAPEGEEALRLWQAFETAARLPGFFEMKRGRTERPVIP